MTSDKLTALAVVPRTLQEARDMASQYARSSLMPSDLRGKEADVFVTLMAGLELGLAPMAALRSIHVVKGKPILSADAMVGLVKASGLCEYFMQTEATPTAATYETKRKGDPKPQSFTFTIGDAQLAGLSGDNWRKYPRQMLMARAKAALARDVYSDVLAGVYEEHEKDEIEDRLPVEGVIIDAEVVEPDPAVVALEARILAAGALKDLGALVDELKALPESTDKERLRQAYKDAQARLVRDYAAELKGDSKAEGSAPADGPQLQLVSDKVVDSDGGAA